MQVRGKGRSGGKDRIVPLHIQVRTTLEELLDELGRSVAGPLIGNRDGDAFDPHILRHTFGADLGRGEGATEPVAGLMGHVDFNTTRRYALPTNADKAVVLDALTVDR